MIKFKNLKVLAVLAVFMVASTSFAAKREIKLVNHQLPTGEKQWVPGFFAVNEGDDVEVTLVNNVESGDHGFFLPGVSEKVVAKKGKTEVVKFKAPKKGIYEFKCHMHAAHVGGQMLVQ